MSGMFFQVFCLFQYIFRLICFPWIVQKHTLGEVKPGSPFLCIFSLHLFFTSYFLVNFRFMPIYCVGFFLNPARNLRIAVSFFSGVWHAGPGAIHFEAFVQKL